MSSFASVRRRWVAALALAAFAGAALAQGTAAPTRSGKPCDTARKKVVREERAIAETDDAIARAKRARETCVSRSACARHDDAIADGERRRVRHETRLARFREEAAAACAPR